MITKNAKNSKRSNSNSSTSKRGGKKRGRKPGSKNVVSKSKVSDDGKDAPTKRGRKPSSTGKKRGRKPGSKLSASAGASVVPADRAIKKRFVLCFFNTKTNKLVGTYLDFDHASNVTGIAIPDIKEDLANATEKTGGVWIKTPVGETINHRIINKIAREKYKKVRTVKRGRRPIDINEAVKTVKGLNVSALDEASIKKINRILKSAQKTKKGKKVAILAD